jgi:quercetin dioxygenase-like cupin family protein
MRKLGAIALTIATITGVAAAHEGPFRPEFQNEEVRVARVRLEPHQKIPMHEVPPHVAVWLTDGDLKVVYPDGRSELQHIHAGQTSWVAMGKHAGENVGARPMEFVVVEPRPSKMPK